MSTSGLGYLVERQAIAEDEIDGALDVAILEVVATLMVVESILAAHEAAVVERRGVACDSERHCLLPYRPCWRDGRRVLRNSSQKVRCSASREW